MATKINVQDTAAVTRQDTFRVNPNDVSEGTNSRMIRAVDYDATVRQRAISIANEGQLQPVRVRRLADKTLQMVAGYTRRDAVLLLREGFTVEGREYKDASATLWVVVEDLSDEDAFLASITENRERADTTPLQDAKAQEHLRGLGWNKTRIAAFYGYNNTNRVAALEKLLTLPDDVQQKVHAGQLALSIATETVGMEPEAAAAILQAATTESGKVDGAAVKAAIRTARPEAEGGSGKRHPRTRKDLERFAEEKAEALDKTEKLTPAAAELLDVLVLWFKDQRNDAYLTKTLNQYCK